MGKNNKIQKYGKSLDFLNPCGNKNGKRLKLPHGFEIANAISRGISVIPNLFRNLVEKGENMKNKWQTVKLGDVCEIQSGGTPSRSKNEYWKNGNIPWVKIGDFSGKYLNRTAEHITKQGLDNSSTKLFSKGTILYSIFATLGETTILNIDATTNQAIAGIKIKDKSMIDTDYLFTYLLSLKEEVNRIGRGVAQNNINLSILKSFTIPLPPLETQQKIAAVLDKAQKIMSESKATLEKYDTLIKSRFIEMFGDKPVESGKWKVEKLEDVCDLITDGTHKTPNYQQKGIRFISAKNIINGKIDLTDTKFITEEEYKQIQKRCRVEKNDVLLTKSGSLGSSAIIDFDIPIGLFESLAVIKYKRNLLNGIFVKELLSAESSQKQFNNGVKGIAIKHLHLNVIAALKIPIPPLSLQNAFAAFVQQIDKSKFAVQKSLEKAETLYKSLMQRYFA